MFKPWSRWILAVGVVLVNVAVLRAPAFANGCLTKVDAPGCAYGLPADQYQAALDLMTANPAPPVQRVPVDQENVSKYSDTRSKPARMASTFSGVVFGAPP